MNVNHPTVLPPVIGSLQLFAKVGVSESPILQKNLTSLTIRMLPGVRPVYGRMWRSLKMQLGSIEKDFYVRAVDLARLLKATENEISRLVRSGVLVRIPDPNQRKAFLYPCLESVTRFVEFRHGKRETLHQEFLEEKSGREKAQRLAIEMTNRQRGGELVDKARLIQKLEPVVIAFRESLLARTDRLVGELSRTKSAQVEGCQASGSGPGSASRAIGSFYSCGEGRDCGEWRQNKNVLKIRRLPKFLPGLAKHVCRRLWWIRSSG